MKKERRKINLDKVENGVKKAGKVTRIMLRIVWTLVGLALIAGIIFLTVRCGQTIAGVV